MRSKKESVRCKNSKKLWPIFVLWKDSCQYVCLASLTTLRLKRTLVLVIGALLCVGTSSAQNRLNAAAIDSYLTPYVRSGNFSGDVLVKQNGRAIFEKAYGFADREHWVVNTSATRFHIASISMQFTSAAVLRLVDQGAISLDTRV